MSDRYFTPRAFSRLYKWVLDEGNPMNSARGETIEILNAHLALRTPRDRVITERWRKLNFPFAIAEWLGVMTGEDSVGFYTPFVKSYGKYSTDGNHVDGAYGPRVHGLFSSSDSDQISAVIEGLKADPLSRREVVSIYDGNKDLFGGGGLNTPCTLSLQFMIRNAELICITTMRSNDLLLGFSNDLIVFTMLQEYVARQLGINPGTYYHNANSLHIYHNAMNLAPSGEPRWTAMMKSMPKLSTDDVYHLYEAYSVADQDQETFEESLDPLGEYTRNLAYAARAHCMRDNELAKWAYYGISDYTIRRVVKPWLKEGILK